MNKEKLFLSFNQLDPILIEESDQYKGVKMKSKKVFSWEKIYTCSSYDTCCFNHYTQCITNCSASS